VRSSDIAARCREIALRVQCSGEWGELAETLTQAATEVERLRLSEKAHHETWVAMHEEVLRLRSRLGVNEFTQQTKDTP